MKLIIDIPDSILETIDDDRVISREQLMVLQKHIANGTPITEGDLISRSALKAAVKTKLTSGEYYPYHFIKLIDNAPTVEAIKQCKYCKHCGNEDYCSNCHSDHSLFEYYERPKGEWIFKNGKYRCSHCGEKAIYRFSGSCSITQTELLTDFCWKCGADMRKVECAKCIHFENASLYNSPCDDCYGKKFEPKETENDG